MNTAEVFTELSAPGNRSWIVKCVALASLVVMSWFFNQLFIGCNVAIAIFAGMEGFIPLRSLLREHGEDVRKCYEEKQALQEYGIELAERLDKLNTHGAGSLFKIVVAISRSRGRMTKSESIDQNLEVAREKWLERLAPIESAVEQCTQLGFGGSLIGMGAAIRSMAAGAGEAGLYAAMSTMASTTLVGLFLSIMLQGLCSNAMRAIDRHESELRLILGLLYGQIPTYANPKDDTDETFFGDTK